MKKKIGIITFHASHNCGSILQAYALQNFIVNTWNVECEIINFSNEEQQRLYATNYKPKNIKELLRNILNLVFKKILDAHSQDYKLFIQDKLSLSQNSYCVTSELEKNSFNYDLYITGSDQVWNIQAKDFDDAYFLNFVKDRPRIAYAVSLGATNMNLSEDREKYVKYLENFDGISVREVNGQKWIQEMTSKKVELCVDPTLLVDKQLWDDLELFEQINEKYIFWYAMTYKSDVRKVVTEISKKYNMPVYIIDAKEWSRRFLFLHGIKLASNGGPVSFLSLIKNAEMVITSSFHGTVFSYKYQKNFWYLNIHSKNTNDDRAIGLLRQLGLENRYVNKKEVITLDLMKEPDYTQKTDIEKNIEKSIAFLNKYIDK